MLKHFFPVCVFILGEAIHKGGKGTLLYAWLIFGSVAELVCTDISH